MVWEALTSQAASVVRTDRAGCGVNLDPFPVLLRVGMCFQVLLPLSVSGSSTLGIGGVLDVSQPWLAHWPVGPRVGNRIGCVLPRQLQSFSRLEAFNPFDNQHAV